jgi:hypothetical protein
MPTKQQRINVAVGKNLHAAAGKAARRQGTSASAYLRSLLIAKLLEQGDLTEAQLEQDDAETPPEG